MTPEKVLILDTTLRDGEQTAGVSFNADEKLTLAKILLEELKVNRIEVCSARVSEGEFHMLSRLCSWAGTRGYIDRVEALGFVDGGLSIDWISSAGGKVVNLLAKGSLRHLEGQLGKTPEQHVTEIRDCISKAQAKGMRINLYLEDWSNGMISSPDYVFFMMDSLKDSGIERFMLPDTLGILNPTQTREFCTRMVEKYPGCSFDFHAHNDYDLATANVFEAVSSGISGIHTTVNGLGERAGNIPVSSALAILNDQLRVPNSLDEASLTRVSHYVETISGIRIPANKPVIGANVFTQTAGIHADGDKKAGLYENALIPERFGRVREYALGKNSGKASVLKNLEKFGIHLTPDQMKKVTARVVELGDKKEQVTPEDLPFIIADVLKSGVSTTRDNIHVVNYNLSLAYGMRPVASLKINIHGQDYQETASGDGVYDAFMKALWKIYDRRGKSHPRLVDYQITIPPGGKTDALVAATISWNNNGQLLKTRGIDSDQNEAAIKATIKMLNLIENIEINAKQQ